MVVDFSALSHEDFGLSRTVTDRLRPLGRRYVIGKMLVALTTPATGAR
jgi:hypothetical protein